MRRKKQKLFFLLTAFLSFAFLIYSIIFLSPDAQISILNGLELSPVVFFILAFTVFNFSLISFLLNKTQGTIFSFLAAIFLLLRFLHLANIFFIAILLFILVSIEFVLRK